MIRRAGIAVLAVGAVLLPGAAPAETARTFKVSASIASGCAVTVDGTGAWGRIDLGTANGATGGTLEAGVTNGVQLACTPGTVATVSADAGEHARAGVPQLAHAGDGASLIPYHLFVNGGTTPWEGQSIALTFPPGTSRLSLPVRARATVPRPARAGRYADVVRITVRW